MTIIVHDCKDGASESAVETGHCRVRAFTKIYKDAHKSLLCVANCMHPDTDDCVYDTLKLLKSKIRELEQVCERENNDCTHCPNRLVIPTYYEDLEDVARVEYIIGEYTVGE